MALQSLTRDWRRFHDAESDIERPNATVHCFDDIRDIIALCASHPTSKNLKAAGSHWALSETTVSDGDFIETNWPSADAVLRNTGLAVDMFHIINPELLQRMVENPPVAPERLQRDPCLYDVGEPCFFVHLRSGTRVYDAYSILDQSPTPITELATYLNEQLQDGPNAGAYSGPWGFQTLGSAGGQTVFGALTTGTHGGDFRQRPIADSVLALHIVTDGGTHYWIEPRTSQVEFQLTDDSKLERQYAGLVPGCAFKIIRDDDVFCSVLVGAGRFGVVLSIVLRVVPQYCLLEHRRLHSWKRVQYQLFSEYQHRSFEAAFFPGPTPDSTADRAQFVERFGPIPGEPNRFLQIALNLSPNGDGDHLCGVTQRWFFPQWGREAFDKDGNLRGRKERGTPLTAGRSGSYEPPDSPIKAGGNSTFISRACGSASFISGLLRQFAAEIDKIVADGTVPALGIAATALGTGGGAAALAVANLCAALAAASLVIKGIADLIESLGDVSISAVVDKILRSIKNNPLIPDVLALMIIRSIFDVVFRAMQGTRDFVAVSYAVMDTHDYLDRACYGNVESLEIFFDASRPDIYCAYIDDVLAFEAYQQEQRGKFSAGYISLRYVMGSNGLIAPAHFDQTVAIEISGLRDASGSVDLVMRAAELAQRRHYDGFFHWGQYNPASREALERHFASVPGDRLGRWRASLRALTEDGNKAAFSNEFTRRTGLEPY